MTPSNDVIEGNSFTLSVSTTTDSPHTSTAVVYIRQDDGSPCQATASALRAATPAADGVYHDLLRPAPVTVDVPGRSFAGRMRICAFVQIVPAPQTTLSTEDLVIPIRAPTGTLALHP